MVMAVMEVMDSWFMARIHRPCGNCVCSCQGLDRSKSNVRGSFACFHSGSRCWLRRRQRWLLSVEALRSHGFVESADGCTREYSHREVMDLVGNSFCGCSVAIATIGLLTLATSIGRELSLDEAPLLATHSLELPGQDAQHELPGHSVS